MSDKHLKEWAGEDLTKVDTRYPLILARGKVMAEAHIFWNPRESALSYDVIELPLNEKLEVALNKLQNMLIDRLEIEFDKFDPKKSDEFVRKQTAELIKEFNISLSPEEKDTIDYYIHRNFVGLGRIEPMFRDPNLEDISCDGVNIPLFVFHRNPTYGSLRTNVIFKNRDDLDSFVMKLAQRCGRALSVAEPLLDGTLSDGSRLQTTFGSDVSRRGSTFTIRKFMPTPLSPVDLLNYGTVDAETLAYLWLAIEHGKSMLVAGASATGKTALLNALSMFIHPDAKIVSIEDTAELRLPHENWIPQVSRLGFGTGEAGARMGEVSMFDLLKASMRQRPDYIIVGEVRGKEANVLFQEMASGHPGLSSMHADSIDSVMDRLETAPISLPGSLIENLDVLIVIVREKLKGKYVRRIKKIVEIVGFDKAAHRPSINQVFAWAQARDSFKFSGKSNIYSSIMEERGIDKESLREEIGRRIQVLNWMKKKGVTGYKEVHKYIDMYYRDPPGLLRKIDAK